MYRIEKNKPTTLKVNESYEGETIEQKVVRIMSNKEPIKDNAPLVYTERKEGVKPDYNIRTDRFEVAIDAMDYVTRSHQAKRAERIAEAAKKGMEAEKNETTKFGGAEPTQATDKKA